MKMGRNVTETFELIKEILDKTENILEMFRAHA